MDDDKNRIPKQVAEYLRKAEDAEAKARATDNPMAKRAYEATAANWRRLANFVEPSWKRAR